MNVKILIILLLTANALFAQTSYVDPFIGTGKSKVLTRWGSEGGTYPGAVAPNGFVQLTPETRNSGYDFSDNTISFFSCTGHFSGFPTGSAGKFLVMPFPLQRHFSHQDEKATPGYYSVLFRDNNTLVEATATERAGMFRFTFPAGVTPQLFVNDSGHFNAVVRYSEPYVSKAGQLVTFAAATSGVKVILVSVSASTVSQESAERNISVELNKGFDEVRVQTLAKWEKALSVISVSDPDSVKKTIFYTALYHSLLMPWIISDVDGQYRGADHQVHSVSGRVEYGGFSPWDTFRSLHPLLSLLFPDKQSEMVLSMLDIFQQTGHLPIESMTGNHAVPIIVDSYLKGVPGIDSVVAYTAMKKSINDSPYLQADMEIYHQLGYIPSSYSESVTRTVEYAYDDWALAQFAGPVMHQEADYQLFMNRSYNYRNLFYADDMFILPRLDKTFKLEPGNSGYKEGDKWVYSYFAPQHQQDLINLMGGEVAFVARLDSALSNDQLVFDNETVFQVPYLFNNTYASHNTQKWVKQIMGNRFKASPGGLPGNDDLGSTSSWYVLSAIGIYPVCPGSPDYAIGVPLFKSLKIHLQNGKDFTVSSTGNYADFIKSVTVDHQAYDEFTISHATIAKGGEMMFEMGAAGRWPMRRVDYSSPVLRILDYSMSKTSVVPDEPFWVRFTLKNYGTIATLPMELSVNGVVTGHKNCLVKERDIIKDSILCRLYKPGITALRINGLDLNMNVVDPGHPYPKNPSIRDVSLQPLIKSGETQQLSFTAQNIGGVVKTYNIPVVSSGMKRIVKLTLQPGERLTAAIPFATAKPGWQTVKVLDTTVHFKVYKIARESLLLDLHGAVDSSGFGHHGIVVGSGSTFGKDRYIEVPNAPGLDVMGKTLTMMAWVFPQGDSNGLIDMFTKGDSHVLQTENGKTLTFFAGGWGRGDVTVPLPSDWKDHWHHIAGVCYGDSLRLYIDGALKGVSKLEDVVNLSNTSKWTFGRNEEFPSARIFNGLIDHMKVFAEPLSEAEVREMMNLRKATRITGAKVM